LLLLCALRCCCVLLLLLLSRLCDAALRTSCVCEQPGAAMSASPGNCTHEMQMVTEHLCFVRFNGGTMLRCCTRARVGANAMCPCLYGMPAVHTA
jgi:hypothetical protein